MVSSGVGVSDKGAVVRVGKGSNVGEGGPGVGVLVEIKVAVSVGVAVAVVNEVGKGRKDVGVAVANWARARVGVSDGSELERDKLFTPQANTVRIIGNQMMTRFNSGCTIFIPLPPDLRKTEGQRSEPAGRYRPKPG